MSEPFWTDAAVRAALEIGGGRRAASYGAVSTDTRSIGAGDLFVALKGERFDAHDFIGQAVEAGAKGVVVSQDVETPKGVVVYRVEDTLAALHKLAGYKRDRHPAVFIGVVGSNGKTTTKELIRSAASVKFRTHATAANLNNQVGVPQTILGLPDDTEVAVIEMGTDRPGEIAALTAVVKPDHIAITSIGEEHLELLGDLLGVLEEEVSVLQGLKPKGMAFVAEEPAELPRRAREAIGRNRVRVAGFGAGADLRPDGGTRGIQYMPDGSTVWKWRGIDVRLPIPGMVNVRNALLALGVATELGIHVREALRGLAEVKLPKLRGEWVHFGELRVLADCYNANPPSLLAAVELLAAIPVRGRRVAVLGTMRELGEASDKLHSNSADKITKLAGNHLDLIVATGEFAKAFAPHEKKLGDHLVREEDTLGAYDRVRSELKPTDTILLKASRGDQMERWLPLLERDFGAGGPSATEP